MQDSRLTMGMPATVTITDSSATRAVSESVFAYWDEIDRRLSPYRPESDLSRYNQGASPSALLLEIMALADETKRETQGYFDIQTPMGIDPSGLVKGWAIWQASMQVSAKGYENFLLEIGGDIQVSGGPWTIGIRNPFHHDEHVKSVTLTQEGIATSGTAARGDHVYNPHDREQKLDEVVSLTVIGPNVYEADRMATAAFAMGKAGILFLENQPGFAGYMIDSAGIATQTSGFETYVA